MDTETGTETSTDSLDTSVRDDLAAAFGEETQTNDSGTTATATAEATPSGEQNASTTVPPEAPKHWSDASKALFAKVPGEVQQSWLTWDKEQARRVDEKYQEIAGFRRERDAIEELFSPYSRDLELQGVSRNQFLISLLGGHKYLQESPREALLWLAQTYGVDPRSLVASPEQENTDPHVQKLTQELSQVRSQVTGFMSQAQQQAHEQKLAQVQAFAAAKGEDGKPLRPHFEEVSKELLSIMKAGEKDLEVAYNKAVRMNDAVWEKVQAEKTAAKSQDQDRQRKLEVDKARRAAVGIESATTNRAAPPPETVRSELEQRFSNWPG